MRTHRTFTAAYMMGSGLSLSLSNPARLSHSDRHEPARR